MARVARDPGQPLRQSLLLYLASSADPQRVAVGPVLAALAMRHGLAFECYYEAPRRGLHFGSGDPALADVGVAGGSLVAGGRHLEQLARLAGSYHVVALGDPQSLAWTALDDTDAELLAGSTDPATLFRAGFDRLGEPQPVEAVVLDDGPQGRAGIRTAPYLSARLLSGPPLLALEASAGPAVCASMTDADVVRWRGLWVEQERAVAFPAVDDLENERDPAEQTYASFTATTAAGLGGWAQGLFVGDPDLVAAQLPRISARRLAPVYGRPHVDVLARIPGLVEAAAEPVFGRQYDDRDFVELAALGHGLQVVDPDPPFESARLLPVEPWPSPLPEPDDPSDQQLTEWAGEGRVLATLCFWAGMVREVETISRLIDLAALTGVRAGLVVTAETVELSDSLRLLGVEPDRGGVAGQLELLLGSTGRGVATEGALPAGVLTTYLREARAACAARLPDGLVPTGWWPLLDTALRPHRPTVFGRAGRRPVLFVSTRADGRRVEAPEAVAGGSHAPVVRRWVGELTRRSGADRFLAARRPFDTRRPGPVSPRVMAEVAAAGLSYMWTKAAFGRPRLAGRHGDLVALPFTAGHWDGWSPFYTVSDVSDVVRAERRLLRPGTPGWLASTVDSPLFALSGEIWRHGSRLHDLVACVAEGGRSGRLVNVAPRVVARYARLLAERSSDG